MLGKLNGHMKSVKLESFLCHIPNVLTGLNLRTKTVKWASLVDQLVKNLPAVWETWVPSLSWEDPLKEGMATHSSIVVWKIPWTEGPGRLQSMGSQKN